MLAITKKTKSSSFFMPALIVAILLFIPISAAFISIGSKAIFNFLAADSMYYLAIANNFSKFGIPTFDGITQINGFHPLWGWSLILLFKALSIPHHFQIYAVFAFSALLVYAAYAITAFTLNRSLGAWPGLVAILALFPGAYSVFFEPRRHSFGEPGILYTISPYSAINGMETSLSLFLFALFFASLLKQLRTLSEGPTVQHRPESFFPPLSRLCLALIVLCRLDDIFLVAAVGILIMSHTGLSIRARLHSVFVTLWPTLVLIAAYLIFNYVTVGNAFPVSGTSKTSIDVTGNFPVIGDVLFSRVDYAQWWVYAARLYPVIFTLLVGFVFVIFGWSRRTVVPIRVANSVKLYILMFGMFLILKSIFLLLFVQIGHQGYWYYFGMLGICNVAFAILVGLYIKGKSKKTLWVSMAIFLIVILFRMPNDISDIKSSGGYGDTAYDLWENSDEIREYLIAQNPNIKIIDNLDGMFVYLLDIPGESITGLGSSKEELSTRAKFGIWNSLVSRGFTVLPDHGHYDAKRLPYGMDWQQSADNVSVVDEWAPPMSIVKFYKLALIDPTMRPSFVELNNLIKFDDKSIGRKYLRSGWMEPEGWGAWTANSKVPGVVDLTIDSLRPPSSVKIKYWGQFGGTFTQQKFIILFDGDNPIESIVTQDANVVERVFPLGDGARDKMRKLSHLRIEISAPEGKSPKDLGLNDDVRVLGFGIRELTLLP